MRARAALLAAATVTGLLVAPTSAAGASETCQGLPATIVADRRGVTTGTLGDDVIVGHGYVNIDARGGNDVICLDAGSVVAGDGNDSVLATGTRGTNPEDNHVDASLGAGDDRYVGGPAEDWVNEFDVGGGSDIISTGGGSDAVNTPKDAPSPYHLVVDLGRGGDALNLTDLPPGSSVQAQAGDTKRSDALIFEGDSADYFFDLGTGEVAMSGVQTALLAGFEEHYLHSERGGVLRVLGTPGPDRLTVSGGTLDLQLGDGPDFVTKEDVGPGNAPSGAIDLGGGEDELWAQATKLVAADLVRGRLVLKNSGVQKERLSLLGLERFMAGAERVVMRGGPAAERLNVQGCHVQLRGGAGPDRLTANSLCLISRADVRGGAGRDLLLGGGGDDRLMGGPGNDVARGRTGTDTCRAEREFSCELGVPPRAGPRSPSERHVCGRLTPSRRGA
jgi:Ca2+-binding RTX toxin-like protein